MIPKLPSSFPSSSPTEEDYSSSSSSDSDSSLPSPSSSSSSSSSSSTSTKAQIKTLPILFELGCRTLAAVPPRRYTCEDCSMTFNKASALAEHIRGSHPTPAPSKPSTASTDFNEVNGKNEMRLISAREFYS